MSESEVDGVGLDTPTVGSRGFFWKSLMEQMGGWTEPKPSAGFTNMLLLLLTLQLFEATLQGVVVVLHLGRVLRYPLSHLHHLRHRAKSNKL